MELEGIGLAIAVVIIFALGAANAMLCRGLGKHTEVNPEFLANMGFWWVVLPVGTIAASRYVEGWNISNYAYFGVVFGLVPILASLLLRKPEVKADPMFGRDERGRMAFLGSRPEEVVMTALYGLMAFEIAIVFLWDELFRA